MTWKCPIEQHAQHWGQEGRLLVLYPIPGRQQDLPVHHIYRLVTHKTRQDGEVLVRPSL